MKLPQRLPQQCHLLLHHLLLSRQPLNLLIPRLDPIPTLHNLIHGHPQQRSLPLAPHLLQLLLHPLNFHPHLLQLSLQLL